MTLLQTIIRPLIHPLLKAQFQAGYEQGAAESEQKYQAWHQRQRLLLRQSDVGVKIIEYRMPPPYLWH